MVVALVVEWFEQEADLNLQVTRKVAEERIDRPEQKCSVGFHGLGARRGPGPGSFRVLIASGSILKKQVTCSSSPFQGSHRTHQQRR